MALDASRCTTEQLLSKIQTTPSNIAVLEQPSSSKATIISTSTTVLYDQPLLTIAKEGSLDQHNAKLSKQPPLDMKTQCTTGEVLLQTLTSKQLILRYWIQHWMISLFLASSTIWMTFERNVLQASDKLLIENGKEFTNKHNIYSMLNQW